MRPYQTLYPFPGRFSLPALLPFLLGAFLSASATAITGTVTDGTTHRPAAGDAVVLIALDQSMREIARTKSDAQGRYSIEAPDPGMHLIRVDHQGAAYFQPAPPNTPSVNLQVYDVAPSVPGVGTEADVLRIEAGPQGLHVTQSIFVKNVSDPPRTQFSSHSYEFYLPPAAQIEGSAAMGPGGMPVQASPLPLAGKDHYAFLFPLRPGETQFQLSYHLPYSGRLSFTPRLAAPAANFVVMLPKSMTFAAGARSPFQTLDEDPNTQTFLVRQVSISQPLTFTVSGFGVMPRDTQTAAGQGEAAPASPSADTRPGGGLGAPIDTPDPLNKYKWWILGGIALALTIGAGFLLRRPVEPLPVAGEAPLAGGAGKGNPLLAALKDELFAIETDRVQGRLSDAEYANLKSAIELVLRRALSRPA